MCTGFIHRNSFVVVVAIPKVGGACSGLLLVKATRTCCRLVDDVSNFADVEGTILVTHVI